MDEHYKKRMFVASCIALVTLAFAFAVRVDIMTDLEKTFVKPYLNEQMAGAANADQEQLVKTTLGTIPSAAFISFAVVILLGGPLVDLLGMGFLLRVAAVCHIAGSLLTIFAPGYRMLLFATVVIGAANGLIEAVCNPLIATVYPEEKTHKLTVFHAWWPGGLVIGGLLAFLFSQFHDRLNLDIFNWQAKMCLVLIPAIIYGVMILRQKFPPTERVSAGVSFGGMFTEAIRRPLFIIVFLMMWLTAATELGPGAWIADIYHDLMGEGATAGILFLVWGSGIMFVLRQFGSKVTSRISPVGLIALTAPITAAGLFFAHYATTPATFFVMATLLYFGFCFWWPTMLGIASERCPKTGALGLALLGGAGNISISAGTPIMGWLNDKFGPDRVFQIWAILPVTLFVVFGLMYLNDKARGGYQAERLVPKDER